MARAAAAIAVVCVGLAAYFAIDAARLRRELSRAAAERDSVVRREADLSRRVAEVSARADRVAGELERLRAEKDRVSGELTRSQSASGRITTLDLSGNTSPRGTLPVVHAGPDIETIRLLVPKGDASRPSFAATVRKSDGTRVWNGSGSPAGSIPRTVSLLVPARLLAPGDYVLSVSGAAPAGSTEPEGDYAFRVRR